MCGLSRKQRWRRQAVSPPVKSHNEFDIDPRGRQVLSCHSDSSSLLDCGELQKSLLIKKEKGSVDNKVFRRVSFQCSVDVVLIPTVDEYKAAHLDKHIWWRREEMQEFEDDMILALRSYMEKIMIFDIATALKLFHSTGAVFEDISPINREGTDTVASVGLV